MTVRNAEARWEGSLSQGKGNLKLGSGAYEGAYSFSSRFESGGGTNPEELLGAAHAGCYSMALNAALERNGTPAKYVQTTAKVHLQRGEAGFSISKIELHTEAAVPGIDGVKFQEFAESARTGCIISKALASVPIELHATLK